MVSTIVTVLNKHLLNYGPMLGLHNPMRLSRFCTRLHGSRILRS